MKSKIYGISNLKMADQLVALSTESLNTTASLNNKIPATIICHNVQLNASIYILYFFNKLIKLRTFERRIVRQRCA